MRININESLLVLAFDRAQKYIHRKGKENVVNNLIKLMVIPHFCIILHEWIYFPVSQVTICYLQK